MFEIEDTTPAVPSADTFNNAMVLLAVATDAKGTADRLKSIQASIAELRKAQAAAERAIASLAARTAEIDKREAAAADVEIDAAQRTEAVRDREARLRDIQRNIRDEGNRFKREILRYSGVAEHFNERLQSLPDWDALAQFALAQPDPHYDNAGEVSGETEPVEHAPAIATITRTKPPRPPRPSRADA